MAFSLPLTVTLGVDHTWPLKSREGGKVRWWGCRDNLYWVCCFLRTWSLLASLDYSLWAAGWMLWMTPVVCFCLCCPFRGELEVWPWASKYSNCGLPKAARESPPFLYDLPVILHGSAPCFVFSTSHSLFVLAQLFQEHPAGPWQPSCIFTTSMEYLALTHSTIWWES